MGIEIKKFCTAILSIFVLFCSVSPVYAHKVYLFAWTEGDTIYTESYFGGDRKVQDGTIKVFNMDGKELLNGKTNDKGEFSFKIPEIADLNIVLESSMGHGAEYLFKKSEFSAEQAPVVEKVSASNEQEETPMQATTDNSLLRKEIDAALEEKLKPVIREIAKLREDKKPGVTEIVGGIGYILGIMGIVAYMKSKKEEKLCKN